MATLSTGKGDKIKNPVATVNSSHYRIKDLHKLINLVVLTYHPAKTETIDVLFQNMMHPNNSFEVNHKFFFEEDLIINKTVCNIHPSQNSVSRVFPPLPYCNESLQFLKIFQFQYPDLNGFKYNRLCKIFVENRDCYATRRNDVGKVSTPFRIRLKPVSNLQTQKHTTFFLHYKEKLNNFLDALQEKGVKRTSWFNDS